MNWLVLTQDSQGIQCNWVKVEWVLLVLLLWPDTSNLPLFWLPSTDKGKSPVPFRTSGTVYLKSSTLQEISLAYVNTNHSSPVTMNEKFPYINSIMIWEHRFGLPPSDMLHHATNYFWINYRIGGHYKLRHLSCILSGTSHRLLTAKPGRLCYSFQMLFDSTLSFWSSSGLLR